MLLGEGQYEGNANQVELPPGVYAQIAMAARRAWNQLPTKGDVNGSLSSIKQGPDELFQDFVDRLQKTAGRIFGDPQSGIPFVTQLAYENANAACRAAIRPYKAKTDLHGYIRLCAEIGPSYNQGLAMAAAFQGTTIHAMLAQNCKDRRCYKCGDTGHFKGDCPRRKGVDYQPGRVSGNCPRCKKGRHWANKCNAKTDNQGRPLSGNEWWGQP